jgi:hypothetical protein
MRLMYLGTRWSWVGSFMPFSFYPWGKSTRGSLDMKLGWLQSWSRRGVDRSLRTHRESNPNLSSVYHNLVTILTELRCRWTGIIVVDPRKPRVIQANLAEKMWVFIVIVSLTSHSSQFGGCYVYSKLKVKLICCPNEIEWCTEYYY